jgi:hypothetical protein
MFELIQMMTKLKEAEPEIRQALELFLGRHAEMHAQMMRTAQTMEDMRAELAILQVKINGLIVLEDETHD